MNHQTSDTPETDGKIKRICGNWNNAGDRVQDFVLADFARKLERERDEARISAEHIRTSFLKLAGGHPDCIQFNWEHVNVMAPAGEKNPTNQNQ